MLDMIEKMGWSEWKECSHGNREIHRLDLGSGKSKTGLCKSIGCFTSSQISLQKLRGCFTGSRREGGSREVLGMEKSNK